MQGLQKQFGLGVGPSFVEYHQLEAGLLRRRAYEAYFGYRKWSQQIKEPELDSYRRYDIWGQGSGYIIYIIIYIYLYCDTSDETDTLSLETMLSSNRNQSLCDERKA